MAFDPRAMTTRQPAPRFRRVTPPPFQLTQRDLDVVRAVGRYGILQSTHLDRLFAEASEQNLRRRLQRLYHAGYLDRPKAQTLSLLAGDGTRPYAYTLSAKGAALVAAHDGVTFRPKATDIKVPQLAHALAVAGFLVECEVASRALAGHGLTFVPFEQIIREGPAELAAERSPSTWRVDVRFNSRPVGLHLQPDAIFGLRAGDATKFFFLEVDNGTMPVLRRSLLQTSLLRKLLAYGETYRQAIHQSRFVMGNMRALFVVPSRERGEHLLRALRELVLPSLPGLSPRLFLVADRDSLARAPDNLLAARWRDGEGAERLLLE